jgi:hypothetical protein
MVTSTQLALTLGIAFIAGIIAGYLYGSKTIVRQFYKYPSSHWRIRGK